MTLIEPESLWKSAVLSPDGIYRYDLVRHWRSTGELLLWIMLNPSTADASIDDPTIRKCQGFARRWGYRGIVVVNLFALRATDPSELRSHPHPVGPDTDETIAGWLGDDRVGSVVEAWGAHPEAFARGYFVSQTVRRLRRNPPMRLGSTQSGAPRHPLYVAYNTTPVTLDKDRP